MKSEKTLVLMNLLELFYILWGCIYVACAQNNWKNNYPSEFG